jgi:hypothetical protein
MAWPSRTLRLFGEVFYNAVLQGGPMGNDEVRKWEARERGEEPSDEYEQWSDDDAGDDLFEEEYTNRLNIGGVEWH